MINYILWILLIIFIIALLYVIVFKKEEVETKYCPKCGSKVKNRFSKIEDIGFGIEPMVKYKECKNCGWTN